MINYFKAIFTGIIAFAILSIPYGCVQDNNGNDGKQGIEQQAIQANSEDYTNYSIADLNDLAALKLKSLNLHSQEYLNRFHDFITSNIETSYFILTFNPLHDIDDKIGIVGPNGFILDSISMAGRSEIMCIAGYSSSQLYDLLFNTGLEEGCIKERGEEPVSTKKGDTLQGSRCANISIIHSLLKLGLVDKSTAIKGSHLSKELVCKLDEYHKKTPGMTLIDRNKAYESFGKGNKKVNCTFGTPFSDIDSEHGIDSLIRTLEIFQNNPQTTFDCSLSVQSKGSPPFNHVEHITGVKKNASGNYEITTINGLNQGTDSSNVPSDPGTNTWEFGPGMGRLKDTPNKKSNLKQDVFNFSFECCNVYTESQ